MSLSKRPAFLALVFSALLLLGTPGSEAAVISVGAPTTTVPSYFGSVTLGTDEFLLPIGVTGAAGLQTWQFDVSFDPGVVTQIEPFPTFYSFGLYAAQFDPSDPNSLASPTSAGFPIAAGLIEQIAGFSQDATGDGILVFLAFRTDNRDGDPNFVVLNVAVTESVPEPATIALSLGALLMLPAIRVARARAWLLPSASA